MGAALETGRATGVGNVRDFCSRHNSSDRIRGEQRQRDILIARDDEDRTFDAIQFLGGARAGGNELRA